jgi:hypothetical protein
MNRLQVGHAVGLSVILYGCETWSLMVMEEHTMLRRIFAPKRDEIIGGCRKLHN